MSNILKITRFGNPLLRAIAEPIPVKEIASEEIQQFIADIRYTVQHKKYGVGLAAPQVGKGIALSVIAIKPTPSRPHAVPFETVIINPVIIETFGRRAGMWEGCISCGKNTDTLYGKAMRYKKIRLQWLDEYSISHDEILEGLPAHVAQHEVDHINGILFVDRVKDSTSFMMADEYRKRQLAKRA